MRLGRLMMLAVVPCLIAAGPGGSALKLGDKGYLTTQGLDVFVFTDIYPDGHQTGVTIVQHGVRVAANGDLRLEPAPGQWSPMPVAVGQRTTDAATGTISQTLSYPDPSKNGKGFNPIFYPDLNLKYSVHVAPAGGDSFRITVDLEQPIPAEWVGKVGFNLELFPTHLFGKSWLMDGQTGIFPRQPNGPLVRLEGGKVPEPRNRQPNGPVQSLNGQVLGAPLATGTTLVVAPEEDKQRLQIVSKTGQIELIDGRLAHNNGWYIVRSNIAAGATKGAVEWIVTPNVVPNWRYDPVIQVSQVGYAPAQPKRAVIELDAGTTKLEAATLYRLDGKGRTRALSAPAKPWGNFLRYRYATFDFSAVREPGMYVIEYAGRRSHAFRIDKRVYARDVWQPTLEYFLPVQMCHMEVREKYRIWHGLDHRDDALMAPVNLNHFDGYAQGSSTLTKYKPGDIVPGLDAGGWHDAGDYDLRVESQMGTVWLLSRMVEEFGLDLDSTTIDQSRKLVEIHDPDGKNDALQQIEHGLLSVLGGYRAMGRLYRGIIEPSLRQYVMLGDAMAQTDNVFRKPVADMGVDANGDAVKWDDRWVFTEDNPDRELYAAAGLAGASRALKASNPALAAEALAAARDITAKALDRAKGPNRVFALAELIHATGDKGLVAKLVALEPDIVKAIDRTGWMLASILDQLPADFRERVGKAVAEYQTKLTADAQTDSPYGVPYKPNIWGAGWDIQSRGVRQYFFHKGWPEVTSTDSYINALNFVLGVHPGENTMSFVSGVGAVSATTAYGVNRADWSYIPGGVISGTNLVRPDLPELKIWPYFWQQTEYVMGGGETNYMFLVLAADRLYRTGQ